MTRIFDELERDWRHVTAHLQHPGDNITPEPTPAHPAPGDAMSLADDVTSLKTKLDNAASIITSALSEDVPALAALGDVVGNDPLIAAVENAADLPAPVRQGLAAYISSLDAAFTPVTTPAVPAPDGQTAEQAN